MTAIKTYPNQMTDTHLLVNDFDYVQPVTIEDAMALKNQHGDALRARVEADDFHLPAGASDFADGLRDRGRHRLARRNNRAAAGPGESRPRAE